MLAVALLFSRLLALTAVSGQCANCHEERTMKFSGTYTIAALFAGGRRNSYDDRCSLSSSMPQYNRYAVEQAEALIAAVEFVNERRLLPRNATLGYEIWDTCSQFPPTSGSDCSISCYNANLIKNEKPLAAIVGPTYAKDDTDYKRDLENAIDGLTDSSSSRGFFFLTDLPSLPKSSNIVVNSELPCEIQAQAAFEFIKRFEKVDKVSVVSSDDHCGNQFLKEFALKAKGHFRQFKCFRHMRMSSQSAAYVLFNCEVSDIRTATYDWTNNAEHLCDGLIVLVSNTEFARDFLEILYLNRDGDGLKCAEPSKYRFLIGQLWGDPSYYPSIENALAVLLDRGVEVKALQYHVGSSKCAQNHIMSLRSNSSELRRNCWFRDFWEQKFNCSVRLDTCNVSQSLEQESSILNRNYKAGLIMDNIMMIVDYIRTSPSVADFENFSGISTTVNNQTGALMNALIGHGTLHPNTWLFDIFNFSKDFRATQAGYVYYEYLNNKWFLSNNSPISEPEILTCNFAPPPVVNNLCDFFPTEVIPTASLTFSCKDNVLVVLPLLIAAAVIALFIFYVYRISKAGGTKAINVYDIPMFLLACSLFSLIVAALSSTGVLEPLSCHSFILDYFIQIENSAFFSWLLLSLLSTMFTSRLVRICIKGLGFVFLIGIQASLCFVAYGTGTVSENGGHCIGVRLKVWSVLAYWYSALVLLFLFFLLVIVISRKYKKRSKAYLALVFVGACLLGYCVLLSALFWQDCFGLTVCVVVLASTPASALFITVILWLAEMDRGKAQRSTKVESFIKAINDYVENSPSEELPTGIEIEEEHRGKIQKVFINPKHVIEKEKIGEGNFGMVFRGLLKNEVVAIKTVQGFASEQSDESVSVFIREAIIMTTLSHPNVMNIIGISNMCFGSSITPSPVILLPYMELGDLRRFLRKRRARSSRSASETSESNNVLASFLLKPVELIDQLNFARQIAQGMDYLGGKKIIHRDLAARNCMIGFNMWIKVSDFGLAREADYYRDTKKAKQLPYRWMSTEAIKDFVFTTESDVWAFGVTLWEIMTKGEVPYSYMSGREMVEELKKGYRLECPRECPQYVYNIMSRCWHENPQSRLSFSQLIFQLDTEIKLLAPDYTDFDSKSITSETLTPELIL